MEVLKQFRENQDSQMPNPLQIWPREDPHFWVQINDGDENSHQGEEKSSLVSDKLQKSYRNQGWNNSRSNLEHELSGDDSGVAYCGVIDKDMISMEIMLVYGETPRVSKIFISAYPLAVRSPIPDSNRT
ncbi:hypothetical protein I7I51_02062 [Histoplasma capsulatum]|uniref:Uncharacterized protein n=1 Tax=Ajellomyces capsulatus TaxID=5037 RepID=A0A8A1MK37_AJECA|nr:hypothetical protein I7I51_02062 [Histoplasma capsulatum]